MKSGTNIILISILVSIFFLNSPLASASFEFQGMGTLTAVGPVLDETFSMGDPFTVIWFYPDNPVDIDDSPNVGFYNNVTFSLSVNDVIDSHSETCSLSVTNNAEGSGFDVISIFCDNPPFDLGPIGTATYDTFIVNFQDDEGVALNSDDLPENMNVLTSLWESAQVVLTYDATIIVEGMEFPIKSSIFGEFVSSPDTDEDGILDVWEIEGLDFDLDGDIDIDFPGMGADPMHKDLFLEIDYMSMHQPNNQAVNDVIAAFADAPQSLVTNPDGTKGINLHIEVDESISHQDELTMWSGFDSIRDSNFGTSSERSDDVKVKAKKYFYRYGVFIHKMSGTASSGRGELPGNDFVVSLGGGWGSDTNGHSVGTLDEQSGTLMHELGHTLKLRHGGGDDVHCKPNYLSVMSYTFQFPNNIPSRPLDYSREINPTLFENDLNEPIGIPGPTGRQTVVGTEFTLPNNRTQVGVPFDFDYDGNVTSTGVSRDINAVAPACDGDGDVLIGYSDWDNILYDFRGTDSFFAGGVHPELTDAIDEMTKEQVDAMAANIFPFSCQVPDSSVWAITESCEISSDIIAPASVIIQNNAVVTVNSNGSLTILSGENIIIVKDSGLELKQGSALHVLS